MRPHFFVLLIGALALLISGCNFSGSNNQSVGVDYHKGNLGITMAFMTNSPPAQAFQGESIPFSLEVRNQGSGDTMPKIWLSGHDENIIKISWRGVSPNSGDIVSGKIPGKGESYPLGGYTTLEASSVNVNLPTDVDSYNANMKVTACYDYTTEASAIVCVDPNPTLNQDDACAVKTVSMSGGQGAPVAVTSVKEDASSVGTVLFTISIQNIGDGTIISRDKIGSCTTQIRPSDLDVVTVESAKLGYDSLSCTPTNPVRLVNGKGEIYCRKSGLSGTAFATALQLNLHYGYKSSISRSISVRRI